MVQSVATRAKLLTRLNAGTEILVAKLEDEFRTLITDPIAPDEDLLTPVIPGIYLLDLSLIFSTVGSLTGTNGLVMLFTGPSGLTDGGYGSSAQLGTPLRNAPGTGLATPQNFRVAPLFINTNQYINRSGWFAVREPGDLVLNWTSIIFGGSGCTLQRGSTMHLVRAINDGD